MHEQVIKIMDDRGPQKSFLAESFEKVDTQAHEILVFY